MIMIWTVPFEPVEGARYVGPVREGADEGYVEDLGVLGHATQLYPLVDE